MRKIVPLLFVAVFIANIMAAIALAQTTVDAADIKLPAPQKTGGTPVLEAIDKRGSGAGNSFPTGAISREELSTILWAASGHNRDGRLWTVPMGMGRPPYCKIYVAMDEGVFLYNWRDHSLTGVSAENVKAALPMQDFVKKAPVSLYFVTDAAEIGNVNNPAAPEWGPLLAGNMTQNIFLAGQTLGVGARIVYSINRDETKKRLQLADGDTPLFVMPMGKY